LHADDRLMIHAQAGTDCLEVIGGKGPAAVGNQRLRDAVADARRVEHHEGCPTAFGRGDRPGHHCARVPLEHDEAPPPDALGGEIHLAAIDEPVLMRPRGFVGMWLRWWFGALLGHMRNVLIDLLVDRQNAADGSRGDVRASQEAPDAELPGVGMALLQVIHLDHEGKPYLVRGRGAALFVQERGEVVRLETGKPAIDGGARDVEKPADTTFVPALIKQSHHVQTALHPVGRAVIRPELKLLGRSHRALEPKLFNGFFVDVLVKAVEENAGEFTGAKPAIERFEPVNLLLDFFGDR
jgi:hypothetical protein